RLAHSPPPGFCTWANTIGTKNSVTTPVSTRQTPLRITVLLSVGWQAANMRNNIEDVLPVQSRFPRRHIAVFPNGRATFGDDQKQKVVRDALDVAFFGQGIDVRHEGMGSASAVRAVAATAIFQKQRLAVFGVSPCGCRDWHQP